MAVKRLKVVSKACVSGYGVEISNGACTSIVKLCSFIRLTYGAILDASCQTLSSLLSLFDLVTLVSMPRNKGAWNPNLIASLTCVERRNN
jgi:hypothetical protein